MLLVVEKIGAAAGDEDDELLLVFWRLGGGDVAALLVPVVCSDPLVDIFWKRGFGRGFEFQDFIFIYYLNYMVYISANGGVQEKRSLLRLSLVPELFWAVINFIGLL
jgi:hypothetical protein